MLRCAQNNGNVVMDVSAELERANVYVRRRPLQPEDPVAH